MKYVKMLGLAAVAAMALMAFLGAGSASATVLCSTATNPCSSDYAAGTTIKASLEEGTSATLSNTSGSIENTCTTSSVEGTTANTGGVTEKEEDIPVTGSVAKEKLSFGGCTNTTDVTEGGELSVSWIKGSSNGTLSAKKFKVTMNLSGISCTYGAGAGTTLGTVTGGSMATMDVHAIVNKQEGSFLCPGDAVWDAKYTVTGPEPLYIAGS